MKKSVCVFRKIYKFDFSPFLSVFFLSPCPLLFFTIEYENRITRLICKPSTYILCFISFFSDKFYIFLNDCRHCCMTHDENRTHACTQVVIIFSASRRCLCFSLRLPATGNAGKRTYYFY